MSCLECAKMQKDLDTREAENEERGKTITKLRDRLKEKRRELQESENERASCAIAFEETLQQLRMELDAQRRATAPSREDALRLIKDFSTKWTPKPEETELDKVRNERDQMEHAALCAIRSFHEIAAKLEVERTTHEAELDALREDAASMDFLEEEFVDLEQYADSKGKDWVEVTVQVSDDEWVHYKQHTVRDAIRAARAAKEN